MIEPFKAWKGGAHALCLIFPAGGRRLSDFCYPSDKKGFERFEAKRRAELQMTLYTSVVVVLLN